MDLFSYIPVLTVHGYALGTAILIIGFLAGRTFLRHIAYGLYVLAFLGHSLWLGNIFVSTATLATEVFELPRHSYLLMLSWFLALFALGTRFWPRYRALFLVLAPVTLILFLVAVLLRHEEGAHFPDISTMFFSIHIGALLGSIGLLAVAFGAGVLFLLQQKSLKAKKNPSPLTKELPALMLLDRVNSIAVQIGFPLFTVGLLFGFVGARLAWGQILSGDPKEVISLGIWGLFAFLYRQRMVKGWQGRKPALLAIVLFSICVFSLTIVNVFMNTHHSFFTMAR